MIFNRNVMKSITRKIHIKNHILLNKNQRIVVLSSQRTFLKQSFIEDEIDDITTIEEWKLDSSIPCMSSQYPERISNQKNLSKEIFDIANNSGRNDNCFDMRDPEPFVTKI